jgi:DNA topoisomerase-1
MKLVIVESPTKAKTLSQILPKEYEIKASMGHIRDLPKSGLGVDVDHDFEPEYVIPDKAQKTINELKRLSKDASEVILATDPDREGEAISWHLYEILKSKTKKNALPFARVVFHEITKHAIQEAFDHLGEINMPLVDAQQARRILDRLVGYKLSPLLWKKVRYGLSAGRVQSVAVRLIVERERERQAFKPEEYWSMQGEFSDTLEKKKFLADLVEKNDKKLEVKNENQAKKIEDELRSDSFFIESVKKTERKKNPYPPFKTSTLQQSMANVFGFSAKRTMDAAQKLFEKGFISYHRTDSFNLSPQFISSARSFIEAEFGKKYVPAEPNFYKTKSANAQEAHEAIRPTELSRKPTELKVTPDELKVYSMVWRRALECQMETAVYDQTTVTIQSEKAYKFRATGSIIKFDGWLAVDKYLSISEEEDETSNILPEFNETDKVKLTQILSEQHFTQPPARYSDATLIKKMEELGVGRPSTYAPTIQTIQARGYVERDGRYFVPKDVAYVVIDLLVKHFPETVDYGFTAEMEEELDEIAEGKREWVPVIREFYKPFEKTIKQKDKELSKSEVTNLGDSDEVCPKCGKKLIYKLGKYGKFLSCSGYPDCDFAKPIENPDLAGVKTEEDQKDYGECDKCHEGKMIVKIGRFGKFLACNNYPKCKNTKPLLNKIDMKCPKCKEGDVVIKFAKKRKFFGCSRYPDCDWSSWKVPAKDGQNSEDGGETFADEKPKKKNKTRTVAVTTIALD